MNSNEVCERAHERLISARVRAFYRCVCAPSKSFCPPFLFYFLPAFSFYLFCPLFNLLPEGLFIAIYARDNATIIFAEALDRTAENTLFLRGCLDTNTSYPEATPETIQASDVSGTVRFRSGNITLAAVEDVKTSPYQIPALVRAKNISLLGARITAQICPYTTTHIDNTLIVNALFNCTDFEMTGGELITDGENKFPTGNALVANGSPYTTTYAYNNPHFRNITNATTQTRSGGIIRAPSIAYLYGFQPNATIPAVCFTNATNSINEPQTADEIGCVTFSGAGTCNQLQFNYATPKSKDEATVLGLPLIPSEQGMRTPEFDLGLSTIDIHTQELLITLAFHVPEDNATLSKTLRVQVLHTHNGVQTIAFDGETFFERTSTTEPLTAVVRCSPPPSTEGTHAYTMRAYN